MWILNNKMYGGGHSCMRARESLYVHTHGINVKCHVGSSLSVSYRWHVDPPWHFVSAEVCERAGTSECMKEAKRSDGGQTAAGRSAVSWMLCFLLSNGKYETLLSLFCVCFQGGQVGLRVGYFFARGSLWHCHVCRLVGVHTHTHTHTQRSVCAFMAIIFTFVWQFLHGPPPVLGPSPALSTHTHTHTHTRTHTYICSDARLPPFYTKLPRFHAWCPSKWMT